VTQVVVLGDVMVDVVARLSGPIALGSDSAARVSWGSGGSAANVAAWLVLAGVERPALVGRVGDDPQGRAAAEELAAGGVDARLAVDAERATGTCVVLVAPGGERSMLPDAGANDGLQPSDLPDEVLEPGGHLHVVGYALLRDGSQKAARSAIGRAKSAGMTVSVDPSSAALLSPEFLDLAEGADLLLPNADEALALTGQTDPEKAAKRLAERFPEVVVKLGAEGALWRTPDSDGRSYAAAGTEPDASTGPLPEPDSTGAGDAFAAGLLAARSRGHPPHRALQFARVLAGLAVYTPGGRPPPGARPMRPL
jgi:sugar/nucleoside kinase (ribokinase family)